eukprot:gene9938-biopygen203
MSLGGGGNFLASPPPQALPPLPGIITTSPQQQQQQQATAAFAAMAAAARAPASRQARMVATSAVRNGGVSPAWGQCICALVSLSFVGAGVRGRARTRGCRFPAWEGDGAGKSIRDGGAHALVPGWVVSRGTPNVYHVMSSHDPWEVGMVSREGCSCSGRTVAPYH